MINGLIGGGEDPGPKKRRLSPKEMQEWNSYLDFVRSKGMEGSPELNKRDKGLGAQLFAEFKKSNPNVSIGYDVVPLVQNEMQEMQKSTREFLKRRNDPNADNVMSGISPVDGWFGSQTSQYRFPIMEQEQYHNDALVSKQNLGLVDGKLAPTAGSVQGGASQVNGAWDGSNVVDTREGKFVENEDGDLVPLSLWNQKKMKRRGNFNGMASGLMPN